MDPSGLALVTDPRTGRPRILMNLSVKMQEAKLNEVVASVSAVNEHCTNIKTQMEAISIDSVAHVKTLLETW